MLIVIDFPLQCCACPVNNFLIFFYICNATVKFNVSQCPGHRGQSSLKYAMLANNTNLYRVRTGLKST